VVLKIISKLPFGFPPVTADLHVWLFAAASMVGLGLVVGILPAMRAKNLSIIEALAVR